MTKKSKRKKKAKQDDYIGFKLIKPVPQDSLLPDYERLKNLNLPAALKATYLTKTIENQSDNELSERYQSQNDTGIKMTPVSKKRPVSR